ncbi:hypothetical protein REC12_02765 [Desulfosporosinus sp. PR]|uniref:hypothetical protein n=1 Tax=Candidatus Desulfosporosinus nitrosoreducens TaxID=3401928 RepID=UPI0028002941|nr:hypothetical protein [Desulfosporosinus sp. PR]MDQ7092507.1 hypothetical protein [Desulfosporosinus sp. PR]
MFGLGKCRFPHITPVGAPPHIGPTGCSCLPVLPCVSVGVGTGAGTGLGVGVAIIFIAILILIALGVIF